MGAALLIVASFASCDDPEPSGPCAAWLPGDLIISEVLANPSGADEGREWVELHSATDTAHALRGLELSWSNEDGSDLRVHVFETDRPLEAGGYFVVGAVPDDDRPTHVDYGYGDSLGELDNTSGRLALRCGEHVLDEVVYRDTADGASRAYDGALPPNATTNDDLTHWCDSRARSSTGDFGSPSERNAACHGSAEGRCSDAGVEREVVAPAVGEVVITELHPNPLAVVDGAGEWFELLVLAEVDLNGLQLGKVPGDVRVTLTSSECVRVTPGTYVLFASSAESTTNGGLTSVNFVADLTLGSTGGGLFVGHDDVVLDAVGYAASEVGTALQLDPRHLTSVENDDEARWCHASAPYGDGDRGTPGGANTRCAFPLPPGMCDDGGVLRPLVPPAPGDVLITELMPDAGAVSDTEGEWFEVYVARDVDLNGLELGTALGSVGFRVEQDACLRVAAGSHVVFAKNAAGANGGLPSDAIDYDTLTLGNGATAAQPGTLFVGLGGTVLDVARWFTSAAGVSRSLDREVRGADGNDAESSWCAAAADDTFGDGDRGTPGEANPTCPFVLPAGWCMDGTSTRAIVTPSAGDLVITEVMADPAVVGDNAGEWFELLATADVDLNGLQAGTAFGAPLLTVTQARCLRVTAGSHVLFARNTMSGANGGLPAGAMTFGFSLANDPGALFIGVAGVLLDRVAWTSSPTGASLQLEAEDQDDRRNDVLTTTGCWGSTPYGTGGRGTPGAANLDCLDEGECWDGTVAREIVTPQVGDLYVSEVMPNPATAEPGTEWFEVATTADVDLNGLRVTSGTVTYAFASETCMRVLRADHLLFARGTESASNGGLPPVDFVHTLSLPNSSGSLSLQAGGVLLDGVTWSTTVNGRSRALRMGQAAPHLANDSPTSWCNAETGYGPAGNGNSGSPGSANTCP